MHVANILDLTVVNYKARVVQIFYNRRVFKIGITGQVMTAEQ